MISLRNIKRLYNCVTSAAFGFILFGLYLYLDNGWWKEAFFVIGICCVVIFTCLTAITWANIDDTARSLYNYNYNVRRMHPHTTKQLELPENITVMDIDKIPNAYYLIGEHGKHTDLYNLTVIMHNLYKNVTGNSLPSTRADYEDIKRKW